MVYGTRGMVPRPRVVVGGESILLLLLLYIVIGLIYQFNGKKKSVRNVIIVIIVFSISDRGRPPTTHGRSPLVSHNRTAHKLEDFSTFPRDLLDRWCT